jgi:hypothetical protein
MPEKPSFEEEMRAFGFDPEDPVDVEFFHATDPSADETVNNYDDDPFEIGGLPSEPGQ